MRSQFELDKGSFVRLFCPPLIDDIASRVFECIIDDPNQQHMKFDQFVIGLNLLTSGEKSDVFDFMTKIFDTGKNKKLTKEDIETMVKYMRRFENYLNPKPVIKEKKSKKKERHSN